MTGQLEFENNLVGISNLKEYFDLDKRKMGVELNDK